MNQRHYLQAIEVRLLSLRGAGLFLNAKDMEAILRWHAGGVALDFVLATLERANKQSDPKVGPRRPAYWIAAVDRALSAASQKYLGAEGAGIIAGPVISDRVLRKIQQASEAVQSLVQPEYAAAVGRAKERLERLIDHRRAGQDDGHCEVELRVLEDELLSDLFAATPNASAFRVVDPAGLGPVARLDYRRCCQRNWVRARLCLPVLGQEEP